MTIEDIEVIAIIVQLKDGNTHQVLASKENKELALRMLGQLGGNIKLSEEIEPITFIIKS